MTDPCPWCGTNGVHYGSLAKAEKAIEAARSNKGKAEGDDLG